MQFSMRFWSFECAIYCSPHGVKMSVCVCVGCVWMGVGKGGVALSLGRFLCLFNCREMRFALCLFMI